MKLLIVGGTGFIGRNFLSACCDCQPHCELTATYRTQDTTSNTTKHGVNFIKYDLLTDRVDFSAYDTCLYVAGNANHTKATQAPMYDLQANVVGLLHFLDTFKGRLIYVSSGAVYHGHVGLVGPYTFVSPRLPYAVSKYTAEMYIRTFQRLGLLREYLIVRLFYAYGPGEPARKLLPNLINWKLGKHTNPELRRFTINTHSSSLIAPMYIDDVVSALWKMVISPTANQTFDLCGETMRISDLVDKTSMFGSNEDVVYQSLEEPIEFISTMHETVCAFDLPKRTPIDVGLRKYFPGHAKFETD